MGNQTKKILVADDDEGILDAVSLALEYNGFTVSKTMQGEKVFTMMKEHPDLLLLDIWMSGENGIDICRKLKKDAITQHIPIIIFSASRNMQSSALEAGANDYIEKPFEVKSLIKKIKEYIY